MLFKENKKKRERQPSNTSADLTGEQAPYKRKPAWTDTSAQNLKVDINNQSRLRKLKQSEQEQNISGKYPLSFVLIIIFSCLGAEFS